VVVQRNAVVPNAGESQLGSYDLYVPSPQDDRVEIAVQGAVRDAIINARMEARGLDRAATAALVTVPRVRSITVTAEGERGTVGALNFILPVAFTFLLFMGVMGAGQGMLTTTIEEKSSRVIEVLLSAVSPLQLMGGKLLGHMGISLLAMSLYLGLGLVALASFSLFGLLDLSLIGYLFIFFLIAFFTIGSLMMAAGAAVNDMREAQQLMMPMTLLLILPWILWIPISRNPDSMLAVVVSFLPPVNTFGMLMRLASTSPPPAWQVWLSIAIGIAGVFGTVWVAAKVFRIGVLMFGKPPDFKTLVRWVRAA
jgi:ABC-2 type transport system permease protein